MQKETKWLKQSRSNCLGVAIGNIYLRFGIPFTIEDINKRIDFIDGYGSNSLSCAVVLLQHFNIVGHGYINGTVATQKSKQRLRYHVSKDDRAVLLTGQDHQIAHAFMMYNKGGIVNIINNLQPHELVSQQHIIRYLTIIYKAICYLVVKPV